MKVPELELVRATTVEDCLRALAEAEDPGAVKVLAGGQSLVPLLALRMAGPRRLVDVTALADLDAVELEGDHLALGALVRHARLVSDALVRREAPVLALAAEHIGHVAIRHRGTLGGSLAHADPAAELPAVAVLLEAELECRSLRGTRRVPAAEFLEGPYSTALADDELLTRVRIPRRRPGARHGFVEIAPREGDYARAGAACEVVPGPDGAVAGVRGVVLAVGPTPLDVTPGLAGAVGHHPADLDLAALADGALAAAAPTGDAARLRLARVALRRALEQACGAGREGTR